jgi:hypothetical protein
MLRSQAHQRRPVVRQMLLVPAAATALMTSARVSRVTVNVSA